MLSGARGQAGGPRTGRPVTVGGFKAGNVFSGGRMSENKVSTGGWGPSEAVRADLPRALLLDLQTAVFPESHVFPLCVPDPVS